MKAKVFFRAATPPTVTLRSMQPDPAGAEIHPGPDGGKRKVTPYFREFETRLGNARVRLRQVIWVREELARASKSPKICKIVMSMLSVGGDER